MTETDRFDEVDRRAHAARAALDAAVADAAVPDLPIPFGAAPRRSRPLLVAAAAVVVLALAGVALLASGDDSRSTIAGRPEITYLVLGEPEALGFELAAAFDGSQAAPGGTSGSDVAVTVQAPADADDPWASTVVEYELPAGATTLSGETVDIGGPEATASTSGVAPTVSWVEGDRVRVLLSQQLSEDELVALARQAVAGGTSSGAALPDHAVLFRGTAFDVLPLLATSIAAPPGVAGVAYSGPDRDSGFVLTVAPGSTDRWRATFAAAETVERTTVRGQDAMIADFALGVTEVSWLEADGTLVRLDTVRTPGAALRPVLDQLTEIDADAFSALVEAHPIGDGRSESSSEAPETGSGDAPPAAPGRTVASVESEDGGATYRAAVVVDEAGAAVLETSIDAGGRSAGSSSPIDSLETSTARRDSLDAGGPSIVVGVIGPDVSTVEIVDRATGATVEGSGPSIATIDGSDHVLFMGVVDDRWSGRELLVIGQRADGSTVEIGV